MKQLNIAPGLRLPVDAVTQTFAILGIRGSGKTNTAVVLVEELVNAGQQVVILDPVDVWWGLRSSASGGAGLPLTILGGEHGDLPLEVGAGAILADFVVDSGVSLVLSLRHLSMSDQRRFAADFAERLYARKGEGKSRSPLHLVSMSVTSLFHNVSRLAVKGCSAHSTGSSVAVARPALASL